LDTFVIYLPYNYSRMKDEVPMELGPGGFVIECQREVFGSVLSKPTSEIAQKPKKLFDRVNPRSFNPTHRHRDGPGGWEVFHMWIGSAVPNGHKIDSLAVVILVFQGPCTRL
jgi:hypothetical protein